MYNPMKKHRIDCKGTTFCATKLLLLSFIIVFLPIKLLAYDIPDTEQAVINSGISLKVNNRPLRSVLDLIEKQTDYVFVYNSMLPHINSVVSADLHKASIRQTMDTLLKGTGVSYEISGRQILLFQRKNSKKEATETKTTATGIVIDEHGEPMPGVSVKIKNGSGGTITGIDGRFAIASVQGETLLFSFVGYRTKESKAGPNMHVSLLADNALLNEVVVIGYGTMKKSDLTGSVSGLNEKDFNKGLVSTPTQMLQGRVTGVNIVNNGGEPGGGATIRIRGSNSIRSGQDPLYVVDGVPLNISENQEPSGGSVSGVGGSGAKNPLTFLNPDDIERIDVLKDASASAIYGARAANGVIMITTKKGGAGKMQVSYSAYDTVSWLPSQIDMLSADDYRATAEKYGYSIIDGGANTNWQDEIFRTSFSNSHNLSISGGSQNGTYRASLAYQDQQGIIKTSSMQKYNGHFYISNKLLDDRLTLELNTTVSRINNRRVPLGESGGQEGDLILSALRLNPTFSIYNTAGSALYIEGGGDYYQYSNYNRNPVAMLRLTDDRTQTDRVIANATATLDVVKGLKYKFNVAFDEMKASRKVEQKDELIYMDDGGMFSLHNVEAHNMLIENYFTYNLQVDKKHNLDFLLGHSYQRTKDYLYGYDETGFSGNSISYQYDLALSSKKDQITGTSDVTVNELQSFFGRANYNLLGRYLFTGNIRVDGSTKFGENNKYGTFPSAAFAWRMSEEEFIKQLNVFDNLKLRISWGITGNQEIPNKISQMLLGSTGKSTIFGVDGHTVPGITLTRTPNPDLKWERTEQVDVGLDFAFFGGRLNGSIDYFKKTTKDVLLQVPSTAPAPTTTVWRNVPDMTIKNHGIELALNGRIIAKKDLTWEMGFNLSTARNEIQDLPVEYYTTGKPSGPGFDQETVQIIKSGYPIGTFWGRTFLGFDEEGKSIFLKDEDGKEIIGEIGCAQPDFTANLSTNINWRNFDLNLNFNGVFGNDIYNNLANVVSNRSFMSAGYNTTHDAAGSDEAIGNAAIYSNRFIEDGSYVRLSSVTLGYTIPLKPNNYINRLRIYLTGNNLFCITGYSGYDPEVDASRSTGGIPALGIGWTQYPMARSISFGMNIQF